MAGFLHSLTLEQLDRFINGLLAVVLLNFIAEFLS